MVDEPDPISTAIAITLGEASLGEDENLLLHGFDSVGIMRIAGNLRKRGYRISFADLIANPTIRQWRNLIADPAARVVEQARPTIPMPPQESAPFDLAPMQHAYWAGRSEGQLLGDVTAHFYHEFDGSRIDPVRLQRAVGELFDRHGMLRARVLEDGRQQIMNTSRWNGLRMHDLRDHSAEAACVALEKLRDALSHRRMDIHLGELFDVQLSLLPDSLRPDGARLHVNLDMIAADAVSLRTLLRDLASFYIHGPTALSPIGFSYPGYLAERSRSRADAAAIARRSADQAYHTQRMPTLPEPPRLPLTPMRQETGTVVRRHRVMSRETRMAFEMLARRQGLTPAMALAALLAETLGAFADEPDFLLNLPLFEREPFCPDVAQLVGDFTGSVLLAWHGSQPGSFAERARCLQAEFHEQAGHVDYGGLDVLRDLSRAQGRPILAPIVFTSALGLGELFDETVRTAFGDPVWMISQGSQVLLDAQVTEYDGGLLVNWDAREAAFLPGVLDAMFASFSTALDTLLAGATAWDRPIACAVPPEQESIRATTNDTDHPFQPACLHDGFFVHAKARPDAPALLWGANGHISYGELAQAALRLAARLGRQGVAHGDVVAIALPKGPSQIVAVLGTLAAGAAYMPLHPDQPQHRRARILSDANVRVVISDADLPGDDEMPLAAPLPVSPDDLAYILYTSGSTGTPKGVEMPHRAAMNTIADLSRRFEISATDRTLALSALDFDLSVFDIFGPLNAGGAMICIEESARRDAMRWGEALLIHGATILNCVPALAQMLAETLDADAAASLRLILLGGDRIPLSLSDVLHRIAPASHRFALGGTTETAIHSTLQCIDVIPPDWPSVPYGTPLANVRCRVVDGFGRDRPNHVAGELWIGGAGLARGYRGDPERTAERFVMAGGERWYRTGDLARYWPDGRLEFLGRKDHQVKILGQRIELGEIETALAAHSAVAVGVALAVENRLVAAVTLHPGAALDETSLRAHLALHLPQAMIPGTLLFLTAMPLTGNGKIDRAAISALAHTRDNQAVDATISEAERRVATAWAAVLDCDTVGRNQNFFSLGGDSLLATRLIGQLRSIGCTDVRLADLFLRPVLADFAAGLRWQDGDEQPAAAVVPDPALWNTPFPATDVQRAYLVGRSDSFVLGGVGCYFYREFDLAAFDAERLENAVNRLIERHPMLRAVFDADGNQHVLPSVPRFRLTVEGADGDMEGACERLRRRESHRLFDPAVWPLFSIRAVADGDRARIAIGIDNLILDALSILIFYEELGRLYVEPDAALPSLSLHFRDCLHARMDEEGRHAETARLFWTSRLTDLPPPPGLPLAVDPATILIPRFCRRERIVDALTWRRIEARAKTMGITPSALLLTAYCEVLGLWSDRPDCTVMLTLFDRPGVDAEMHRVLGDFTSLVLVASTPKAGETWAERVRGIQKTMWSALDHRAFSALRVLREAARVSGEAQRIVPVVFTSALGVGQDRQAATGPFLSHVWGISQTPQIWLDHQVTPFDGGIRLTWDSVDAIFPPGLLDAMFGAYTGLVTWLAVGDWNGAVPDLLPATQRDVRTAANDTGSGAEPRLLHDGFFARAAEAPDRVALICPASDPVAVADTIAYGQLADRALRLAAALIDRGIGAGERVAIAIRAAPNQALAALGILAAGATYVPIGIDLPDARRTDLYERAGIRGVLTDAATMADTSWPDDLPVLILEECVHAFDPLAAPRPINADTSAYIIFTSGSGGLPKGVEMSHRAASNTVVDVAARCALDAGDRLLAVSAFDFDLSVFDLFGVLGAGGAVVTVAPDDRREARRWADLIRAHGVTVWNSAPALLDMVLAAIDGEATLPTLRVALLSGDWIGLDLPDRLRHQAPDARFLALGGATEAGIWSNLHEVVSVDPRWASIPYGKPLRHQRFRVVDPLGRDCPDGVAGELWIGGAGLACGYVNDADRTAAAFVTSDGERWYRTGDLGRYGPDGVIEFLGRLDHRIKLRGHRIDPGEIEAALCACAGVARAIAVVVGQKDMRRLAAAVLPEGASAEPVAPIHPATPPALAHPRRATLREAESRIVDAFLIRLLGIEATPGQQAPGAAPLIARLRDGPHWPVVRLWKEWLVARGVLRGDGGRTVGGKPTEVENRDATVAGERTSDAHIALALAAGQRLDARIGDIRAMLLGERAVAGLLDDDLLAPMALAHRDPDTEDAIRQIAAAIADRAATLGRPVDVAELGAGDGRTAQRLLSLLSPEQVRYVLVDSHAPFLRDARRRLSACGHAIHDGVLPEGHVPAGLLHRFDMLFAFNSLHRFRRAEHGPALASLMLRPGGMLLAVERCELTPLALVTAGLLDNGYDDLDLERRSGGGPCLAGHRWADLLAQAGFAPVSVIAVGTGFTERLTAIWPDDRIVPDPAEIRNVLARRLPSYMVPDRIALLPWLPLTANGKVDRAAVARNLAEAADEGREPVVQALQPGLQQDLAIIWQGLLQVAPRSPVDTFFDLGGDSLLATRLLARLRAQFGVELSLREFFADATLGALTARIEQIGIVPGAMIEEGAL